DLEVVGDEVVRAQMRVGGLGRVDGPRPRKEIAWIGYGRDGNPAVDGIEQADSCLLGHVLAVVLEVALDGEAIQVVVEAGAGELAVTAEPAHAVLERRRRTVDAHAQLSFVAKAAADIHRAAELAE